MNGRLGFYRILNEAPTVLMIVIVVLGGGEAILIDFGEEDTLGPQKAVEKIPQNTTMNRRPQ